MLRSLVGSEMCIRDRDVAQALKKVKDPEDILVKRFLKEVNTKGAEPVPLVTPEKPVETDKPLPGNVNP